MMGFDDQSWNVRDTHMMETLERLLTFHGKRSKGIVREHNTHIGDARATDMKRTGMVNLGQLARVKYGEENVYLCGFGSFKGTVIAGGEWGANMQEMTVPPARQGSVEEYLHNKKEGNGYVLFGEEQDEKYENKLPHRAIGVVYNPANEKYGNYVSSLMRERYDAFIFIDKTKALHPIHIKPGGHKMPDTSPFGM